MQTADVGAGVDAEFVGQRTPNRREGGQGIGLPPGAAQGEHALRPEPFDERGLGEQRTELDQWQWCARASTAVTPGRDHCPVGRPSRRQNE